MLTYVEENNKIVPFYCGCCDRKLHIIQVRLRNVCSSLNIYLHLVNLKSRSTCMCGQSFDDCMHFFFKCPFYNKKCSLFFLQIIELRTRNRIGENLTTAQNSN